MKRVGRILHIIRMPAGYHPNYLLHISKRRI